MKNTTLGLLVVLVIITISNQYGSFVEGFEQPTTIGDDNNLATNNTRKVLTKDLEKKISDLKQSNEDGTIGIDLENIKAAIMSKDSKQIPVDPDMNNSSTGEVNAFTTGMLTTSKLEGFTPYFAGFL
jgi:hypothetical protein